MIIETVEGGCSLPLAPLYPIITARLFIKSCLRSSTNSVSTSGVQLESDVLTLNIVHFQGVRIYPSHWRGCCCHIVAERDQYAIEVTRGYPRLDSIPPTCKYVFPEVDVIAYVIGSMRKG